MNKKAQTTYPVQAVADNQAALHPAQGSLVGVDIQQEALVGNRGRPGSNQDLPGDTAAVEAHTRVVGNLKSINNELH